MFQLKITEEEIDIVVKNHYPPRVYVLEEGLTISDVEFPVRVGGWKLSWVGLDSTGTSGFLVPSPMTPRTKSLVGRMKYAYFVSLGFTEKEANWMADKAIKYAHDVNSMMRVSKLLKLQPMEHSSIRSTLAKPEGIKAVRLYLESRGIDYSKETDTRIYKELRLHTYLQLGVYENDHRPELIWKKAI